MPKGISSFSQRAGATVAERLAFYSDRSGGPDSCWLWTGGMRAKRYGNLYWNNRSQAAHRLSWIEKHGPIPSGFVVCHRCDVPLCINPSHLFLGTQADNVHDMEAKRRSHHPRGEDIGAAKLTNQAVRTILSVAFPTASLAAQFGVDELTIRRVKRGKSWGHVT